MRDERRAAAGARPGDDIENAFEYNSGKSESRFVKSLMEPLKPRVP